MPPPLPPSPCLSRSCSPCSISENHIFIFRCTYVCRTSAVARWWFRVLDKRHTLISRFCVCSNSIVFRTEKEKKKWTDTSRARAVASNSNMLNTFLDGGRTLYAFDTWLFTLQTWNICISFMLARDNQLTSPHHGLAPHFSPVFPAVCSATLWRLAQLTPSRRQKCLYIKEIQRNNILIIKIQLFLTLFALHFAFWLDFRWLRVVFRCIRLAAPPIHLERLNLFFVISRVCVCVWRRVSLSPCCCCCFNVMMILFNKVYSGELQCFT